MKMMLITMNQQKKLMMNSELTFLKLRKNQKNNLHLLQKTMMKITTLAADDNPTSRLLIRVSWAKLAIE